MSYHSLSTACRDQCGSARLLLACLATASAVALSCFSDTACAEEVWLHDNSRVFGLVRGVTSDGKIRTCLFSQVEHDLYGRMRAGESDEQLAAYIHRTIQGKEARHHIGEPDFLKPSRSMVHIGG